MYIKRIKNDESAKALKLVLSVFMAYEAPDYSDEGIETFKSFIAGNDIMENLQIYGAYKRDKIVGVIATRKNGSHISLFFVDGEYHRQGIGRKLFETVVKHAPSDTITVNSSPYAVKIYRHLGFISTDVEQLEDGIRYTPMVYHISKKKERLHDKLSARHKKQPFM